MKLLKTILAVFYIVYANNAFACIGDKYGTTDCLEQTDTHEHKHEAEKKPEAEKIQNTVKLEMVEQAHHKEAIYTVKLTDIKTGKLITDADLKTVHTKKLHLLVVDPSLTEYHHLHPVYGKNGEWTVYFLPEKTSKFRVWADITPVKGNHEYMMTDIGTANQEYKIDKTVNTTATNGEYKFDLSLDGKLKAGVATMAKIKVSKNGKPFNQLEPVMGAYAHVVGFVEDYKSIMHIHPMGKEPETADERGGDVLEFHIETEKAGFVKLFAQFKIDGKDVFVPFGVMVK